MSFLKSCKKKKKYFGRLGITSVSLPMSWSWWSRTGRFGLLCWRSWFPDPDPDEQHKLLHTFRSPFVVKVDTFAVIINFFVAWVSVFSVPETKPSLSPAPVSPFIFKSLKIFNIDTGKRLLIIKSSWWKTLTFSNLSGALDTKPINQFKDPEKPVS